MHVPSSRGGKFCITCLSQYPDCVCEVFFQEWCTWWELTLLALFKPLSHWHGDVGRGDDVSWRYGGSRGSRGEIKHVQFFLRLFGDFFKSPVGLGDVAATPQRLNMFSRRKTSPRRLRDVSETCSRPNDWGKVATTSPRRPLTYFYRHRKEIIKKAKTCIYL